MKTKEHLKKHGPMLILLLLVACLCHLGFLTGKLYFTPNVSMDSGSQYIPFRHFLSKVIENREGFWSFKHGLGGDVYSGLSYYYSTSPIFYIELFLKNLLGVNWNNPYTFHTWRILFNILVQWMSMLGMYLFLIKEEHKPWTSLIGASVYGSFLIFMNYIYTNDFMAYPLVFLPLAMVGIREFQRTKRAPLLVIGVSLVLMNNFYFAFISGLFCLMFVLITTPRKSIKSYVVEILSYVPWALLSLGVASFAFIPSLAGFFQADRLEKVIHTPLLPPRHWLESLDHRLLLLGLGLPLLFFLSLMVFRKLKTKDKERVLLSWILILMSLSPRISSLFVGFQGYTNRWHYLIIFSVAMTLPILLEHLEEKKMTRLEKILSFLLLGALSIKTLAFPKVELTSLHHVAFLLMVLGVVLSVYLEKNRLKRILIPGILLCMIIPMILQAYEETTVFSSEEPLMDENKTPIISKEKRAFFKDLNPDYREGEFWRISDERVNDNLGFPRTSGIDEQIYSYWYTHNFSMLNDYPGTTLYSSFVTRRVHQWMKHQMHIRQSLRSPSIYFGLDNRRFIEALWSVKHRVDSWDLNLKESYDETVGIDLWYDKSISKDQLEHLSDAEKDALLLQVAVLEEPISPVEIKSVDQVTELLEDESFKRTRLEGVSIEGSTLRVEKGGHLVMDVSDYKDLEGEFLLSFSLERSDGLHLPFRNLYDYNLLFEESPLSVIKKDFIYYYPAEKVSIKAPSGRDTLTLSLSEGTYELTAFKLYFNAFDQFPSWMEKINRYNLEDLVIESDLIKGRLHNETPGILAFSIPYDKGWKVYVDGKREEMLEVNQVQMGVYLEPGEKEVELRFFPWLLKESIIISLLSILTLILLTIRKKGHHEKTPCGH